MRRSEAASQQIRFCFNSPSTKDIGNSAASVLL